MSYKYGCLPGRIPAGLRDLTFYAAGALPRAPSSVQAPSPAPDPDGTPWGVDGNDRYGDCGPAGIKHYFQCDALIAGEAEGFPLAADVIQYYLTYTGGQDTGVELAAFLSYVRQKEFFGHTVSAYAPVAVHDIPTLQFAIWAYGGAYAGIRVTDAMMRAFGNGQPWEMDQVYSRVDGGHCIPLVGYDGQYLYAVTWGKVQPVAYSAWHYICTEAWGVLTGEFVAAGGDTRGVNLQALQGDLSAIGSLCAQHPRVRHHCRAFPRDQRRAVVRRARVHHRAAHRGSHGTAEMGQEGRTVKSVLNGGASKFLVSVMGAVMTGLGTYYGGSKWEPIASAAIGALLVYLVPNSSSKDVTPPK